MSSPLFQKFTVIVSVGLCIVLLNLSYYHCNAPFYPNTSDIVEVDPKQADVLSEIEFYTPQPTPKTTPKPMTAAPTQKPATAAAPICKREGVELQDGDVIYYYYEDDDNKGQVGDNVNKNVDGNDVNLMDKGNNINNPGDGDIAIPKDENDNKPDEVKAPIKKRRIIRRKLIHSPKPIPSEDPNRFIEKILINSTINAALPKFLQNHIWAPDTLSQYSACSTPIDLRRVRTYASADWLSGYAEDVTRCYCGAWSFFIQQQNDFQGESGLEHFQKLLARINSEFRLSSMNVYANLSPRSKYSMDMLEAYNNQLYINVGFSPNETLKFFQSIEPVGKKFVFFEPVPKKQDIIHELMLNETRLNLVPLALADNPGNVSLNMYQFHSYGDQIVTPVVNTTEYVNVTTLDLYLLKEKLNHIPISILSIDAEGFDVAILRGARETLSRVRMVIFECHRMMRPSVTHSPGGTHYEVQELLAEYGFISFKMSKRQWVPFTGHWYHLAADTPSFMGWHKCIALRHDDTFLDRVWPEFNALKACQYKPPETNKN